MVPTTLFDEAALCATSNNSYVSYEALEANVTF